MKNERAKKSKKENTEENIPFLNWLLLIEKGFTNYFNAIFQTRKRDFTSSLETRIGSEEKKTFILKEIKEVQISFSDESLNTLYALFNVPYHEMRKNASDYTNNLPEVTAAIENEELPVKEHLQEVVNVLSQDKIALSHSVFSRIIESSKKFGKTSEFLDEWLKKKNPQKSLVSAVISHHYERKYLEFLSDKLDEIESPQIDETENTGLKSEFTTARQVQAIWYILEQLDVTTIVDLTEIARFIQFITGKETGVTKIVDTNIYKKLKAIHGYNKKLKKDLQFIKPFFDTLGLTEISKQIKTEIESNR